MAGKHRSEAGATGPGAATLIAWGLALLLVIGGVVVVRALATAGASTATGGNTATASATATPTATRTATPTASATTATAGSGTGGEAAVAAALDGCRAQVAAQERLRRAGEASYRDWNMHVTAQLGLADGSVSLAEAKVRWAESRARGGADLAAYRAAADALRKAGEGCARLADLEVPAGSADRTAAARCTARSAALAPLLGAAAKVNAEWAAHVGMMQAKSRTPHDQYSARWLQMVEDAQPTLRSYAAAAAKAARIPACSA